MTDRFKNKVVLITGAGQGIGLATARRMASEGAIIIAGILDDTQAEAVNEYEAIKLDVRHEESWISAMDLLMKSHGGLDVLINNAGISPQATAEETTPEFWDEVMAAFRMVVANFARFPPASFGRCSGMGLWGP